jgi:hypothetical protein
MFDATTKQEGTNAPVSRDGSISQGISGFDGAAGALKHEMLEVELWSA